MTGGNDNDRLIDRWLDETIDESEMNRLNEWIKRSPENAAWFAQRSHLHSQLFDWADTMDTKVVKLYPKTNRFRISLIAAAIIGALILSFILIPRSEPGSQVARLKASPGGVLQYQGKLMKSSDPAIRTGRYELEKGISSIQFENGVEVVVEAPAIFEIESAMKMNLTHGRLAANVSPEGIGFEIATPSAHVIDHGTEFAVEVADDQSSEVHVFKGEVEVQPLAEIGDDLNDPVHLFSNAATRVEFASHVPMGIPIDNHRFLRTLAEPRHAYAPMVKQLNPSLYFRCGIPKDGVTMRDAAGEHDGFLIDRGSSRPPFCPGKIGSAGRFNGPKDGAFIHVPDYPKTGFALSGVCWIYAESLPRNAAIAKNSQRPRKGQFRWRLDHDTGCVEVRVLQKDGAEITLTESKPLPIKEWQHIAFVANGEFLQIYRNGEKTGEVPCGPLLQVDTPELLIGARWKNREEITPVAHNFWHGRIDEFALFNQALTAQDILNLYKVAN